MRVLRLTLATLVLSIASAYPSFVSAGTPGVNGALTVTAANTVVNLYTAVTSVTARTVTVSNIANLSNGALGTIGPGSVVLIYQAQGATMTSPNDATYGTITAYNGAGFYDFVTVGSVSGNTITISAACTSISHVYGTSAQAVRVPQYSSLTVNAGGSIVAAPWSTALTGGVVAIDVAGATTVNGTIDTSGQGFVGGIGFQNSGSSFGANVNLYVDTAHPGTSAAELSAAKGEGIAGNDAVYDALYGSRNGRGAPANGGGGGDGHNAGGGGGANGNNGNPWSGQGLENPTYDPYFSNANGQNPSGAADPGYAQMSQPSSGGGRGGYTYSGDGSHPVGGLGGRPLNTAGGRLFFGGGGGAGDANNSTAGSGGSGGGLVVLNTGSIGGSGTVLSQGVAGGPSMSQDAAGGGGGGGSVLILSGSGSVAVDVSGGVGGNELTGSHSNVEAEGPGGGGGGGYAAAPGIPISNGGVNGTTASTIAAAVAFPVWGATRGTTGAIAAAPTSITFYCYTPVVGSAKAAAVTNNLDGTYTIVYSVVLQNYGDTPLTPLTATDTLTTTFPSPATFTVLAGPVQTSATAGASATYDVGFNGAADTNLLTAGTLPIGGAVTFNFSVKVKPPVGTQNYSNVALASGTGVTGNSNGFAASDTSNNGANPDPAGLGNPNQASENIPTPVSLLGLPAVSKTVQNLSIGGSTAVTANTASPNDQIQYVLSFTNTTGQPLTGFSFADAVPNNTGFVSAACITPAAGAGCTIATAPAVNATSGNLSWTFSSPLANNATYSVSFVVKVL